MRVTYNSHIVGYKFANHNTKWTNSEKAIAEAMLPLATLAVPLMERKWAIAKKGVEGTP